MTCADYRAAMSAHLDGELADGPDQGPQWSSHLVRCADCAAWLAGARRAQEMASAARSPSPQRSERIVAAVLAALSGDERVGNGVVSVAHEGS
ncbi:putative anti-sigma-YlaC factor YlaD [Kitasatospora sp. MAP12-15]|uniref:hypothetical protein n=1 Tax=unclassified Kitasatospora TaxID=2633591 RepID=UPI0024770EFC|nr:hypothetical protein [Kitasatospora sp. MAP12-44]MDH6115337.1 putative anti-sigma-YlaC factor YlaD [Kitasatospora sp. MAP12-44]